MIAMMRAVWLVCSGDLIRDLQLILESEENERKGPHRSGRGAGQSRSARPAIDEALPL